MIVSPKHQSLSPQPHNPLGGRASSRAATGGLYFALCGQGENKPGIVVRLARTLALQTARCVAAVCLLLAVAGCDGPPCKGGACDIGETRAVVITNYVDKLTIEALNQLIGEATEALLLDEPENPMPPMPTAEEATGTGRDARAAATRRAMRANGQALGQLIQQRQDMETRLRNDNPDVKTLWQTHQTARENYNQRVLDELETSLVPQKIAQLTRLQQELHAQLRKLEELK